MPPSAERAAPTLRDLIPTNAQPKLRTIKLWLGAEEMTAEIAATPKQIAAGMMFRTNIEPNAGMLFVLPPPPDSRGFWATNCPLKLTAAFLDPSGFVLEVHDLETNPVATKSQNVQYALETSRGWFDQHHISPGMLVRTEHGSFPDTFYRKTPVR
jgi:uncharacterized membrane protein (UPF0127 family)